MKRKRQYITFNGKNYSLNPKNLYWETRCKINGVYRIIRLHRAVWEFYNGEIPKGYHIHHIDKDKSNNNIDNLELLSPQEHSHKHAKETIERWKTPKMQKANEKGREKCKEWHRSAEGKMWHSQHQKETVKKITVTKICPDCGREFSTWTNFRGQDICRKCRDKHLKRKLRLLKK